MKDAAIQIRYQFACSARLPLDPEGPGHKLDVMRSVAAGMDERETERQAQALGKAANFCATTNLVRYAYGKGRFEIRCAYCGQPAFVLLVVSENEGGARTVLVREASEWIQELEVEVERAE